MHSPDPIDLNIERRLTALETQMTEVYRMFSDIKIATSEIISKVTISQGEDSMIRTQFDNIKKDLAEVQNRLSQLDTVYFFSRNPKIAILCVAGLFVMLVPGVRRIVGDILTTLFQ